jgi:uncharacterized protein
VSTVIAKLVVGLCGAIALSSTASLGDPPALPSAILDHVGTPTSEEVAAIDASVSRLERSGVCQCQVQIAPIPAGETIEAYAERVFSYYQLGGQKTDDGLLIVIDPLRREARIEVGQGLEGDLPDAVASRVIHRSMLPKFREGAYGDGILAGLADIAVEIGKSRPLAAVSEPANATVKDESPWGMLVLAAPFSAFLVLFGFMRAMSWKVLAVFALGTAAILTATLRDFICSTQGCENGGQVIEGAFLPILAALFGLLGWLRYSRWRPIVKCRDLTSRMSVKASTGGSDDDPTTRTGGGGATSGGGATARW